LQAEAFGGGEERGRRSGLILRLALLAGVFAVCAEADTGIPMLAITWPGMVVALIPVVLLEWWVMTSRLTFSKRKLLKLTAITNVVSTVVGIPLAWLVYFFFSFVVSSFAASAKLQFDKPLEKFLTCVIAAPWLGPVESSLDWMVPTAILALMPAYFIASWAIEYGLMRWLVERSQIDIEPQLYDPESRAIRSAVFAANLASYAFLAALTIFWLVMSLIKGSQPD
jgi:hypothetical protein